MKMKITRWGTALTLLLAFLASISPTSLTAQNTADGQLPNLDALEYRELGPYRGGRVTAVAGIASLPGTFYFGATGGGVWKSEDYGQSWENISDGFFKTPSIGALEVAQNDPNILYVGTGTDGLRSNVIEGMGVYKSIDAGKNWMEIGLENTGQIGGLRIDPTDHNTVYVAAIGNAFKDTPDRGLYKTTDGGKNWERILYISQQSGVSDVELLPGNPRIVFATAWKARRTPWTIISGGTPAEGGIYKSVDGGSTWSSITKGLPSELIGKIDIAVCPSDSRIVYALVEAPGKQGGLYKSTDQGESFTQVSSHNGIRTRPFYYTNLRVDPTDSEHLYALATGYYESEDGGETWSRLRPPHGDNHDQWINPNNPDLFIQSNDGGANVTHNGGKTWSTQFNQPTAEIYQIEADNQFPYWVYGGQQDNYSTVAVPTLPPYGIQTAGPGYILNTGGCETGPAVPHPTKSDIVYSNCKGRFTVYNKRTGTEQSYYVGAANMYGHNPKDLKYRFQRVSPIHISPHDPATIYHTSQFVHKTTDEGKTWEIISPDLTAFEADKQVISGSPITRDITGEEFYSTIYAIRESPVQAGVIWVGANDGPVHVTRDGGASWSKVTPRNLPPGGRVDAVEPSPHDPAKAYIAVLRYQLGDRKPYIYKTEDYGRSWDLLTPGNNGLPSGVPTRVIREHPQREGLLFAGTETGVFMSVDDGKSWEKFQQNLPLTPVTDMKLHRGDLVLSTMGRGFWMMDRVDLLAEALEAKAGTDGPMIFSAADHFRYRSPSGGYGSDSPRYPNPGVILDYILPKGSDSLVRLDILDASGKVINSFSNDSIPQPATGATWDMATGFTEYIVDNRLSASQGLNRFTWDMRMAGPWHPNARRRFRNGPLAGPGTYTARITSGDQEAQVSFELKMDPRVLEAGVTSDEVADQLRLAVQVREAIGETLRLQDEVESRIEEIDGQKRKSDAETKELEALENLRDQLKTAEGIYMQPMLADQWRYLYYMLLQADQAPGADARQRYSELNATLTSLKSSYEGLD
ncbi:Sortilin, neurotensin receptor 3 [Robiginitalea myxolifaciens]|uniref:Sortilin, neurotensin receptor 3 n=1 Tax=Robiginitalea myxolifaciens TaxID=400055 RepID=A0A1I6FMT9_9FLAO|nr:hypothetical protein [Robiginitalea myxolifaciens]SFR31256.1 Sortilin, neurotensin receptor 3 [Robiginitalea myxolifaciens]